MNIEIKEDKKRKFDNEYIIIAIDHNSIKVTNSGQWMRDKWNVKNNSKRYLKINVAVNERPSKCSVA